MSATYTHHPKAPTGQALDQEAPTSHTTPPAFKHTGTRSIRSSLSKAAAPKHLNLDNSLGFQYSGLSPEVPGQQLCHGEGQLNFGVRPPPSPSAIHPSYGLDHASKNVTNAWSGSRPQAPDNPTDRPSSPSESNNSSTFDETVDLQSSQSGSVNSSAHYASARFSPLHQSVSRSPKVSQHSPIAVYKDKPKSAGLLSKSLFQSQNLQQTKTPFEESALGAFLSKPAVAKVLDSPTAWIFYYFILNLGLTLCAYLLLKPSKAFLICSFDRQQAGACQIPISLHRHRHPLLVWSNGMLPVAKTGRFPVELPLKTGVRRPRLLLFLVHYQHLS